MPYQIFTEILRLAPKLLYFLRRWIFAIFTYIFAYNLRITEYFKNLIISHVRTFEHLSEMLEFLFEKKFCMVQY